MQLLGKRDLDQLRPVDQPALVTARERREQKIRSGSTRTR